VYFSAASRGRWPASLPELKSIVRENASATRETLERRYFDRVPSRAAAPDRQLDHFYSTDRVDHWRAVLGPAMHYHFGLFANDSTVDAALDRAVTELYAFIPPGGRVYDVGCGWGATARMLTRDLGCDVVGITASRTQFRFGRERDLDVRHGDAEATLPPGRFDCMLALESFSHIRDKQRLLRVLRVFGRRLVMREHCQDASPRPLAFGGTMHMVSSEKLRSLVEGAGWTISHWRDRRLESMPTIAAWHQRLQAIPPGDDLHLETLRAWTARVLSMADEWAACNPLIELVAE
jgi:cyclopropane fatty-acyl-phospholipid synthase-like methyltransferase